MAKSQNQRINLDVGRGTGSATKENTPMESEDGYASKIQEAQAMIEELELKKQRQQEEERRQKQIQSRRDEFSGFRFEVVEKLTEAIPRIDSELEGSKQEILELDQAKKHFLTNLKAIEAINPERWSDDEVFEQSDKFQSMLSKTARDYDQFVKILAEGNRSSGSGSIQNIAAKALTPMNTFGQEFLRGFAFSLPLIIAISIIVAIVYNN